MAAKSIQEKSYNNLGNPAVESLIPTNASTMLDVGCGVGGLATALAGKGLTIDGITISPTEAERAGAVLNDTFIHNLETGLPKLRVSYDVIVCSHVLEHIANPSLLLRDIRKALAPGGTLIIAVPNVMHYMARIELLKGNFHSRDTGIWDNTHLKWYTFDSAAALLRTAGFQVRDVLYEREVPRGRIRSLLGFKTPLRLPNILASRFKGLLSYQIVISCVDSRTD